MAVAIARARMRSDIFGKPPLPDKVTKISRLSMLWK